MRSPSHYIAIGAMFALFYLITGAWLLVAQVLVTWTALTLYGVVVFALLILVVLNDHYGKDNDDHDRLR